MHPGKFQDSKINFEQKVKVHLYNKLGHLIQTVEGVARDREKDVPISKNETRNLIWVTDIDYDSPHLDQENEGWFAESDLEPITDSPLDNLSMN